MSQLRATTKTLWKRLLLAVAGFIAVVILLIVGSAINTWRLMPESYAAWTTGNLMVEFLQTHSNQWPRSWQDLQAAKESYEKKNGILYTEFDRLPGYVKIDWQAEPAALSVAAKSNSNSPLLLITRLDGTKLRAMWGPDTDPNLKIMNYFRGQPPKE